MTHLNKEILEVFRFIPSTILSRSWMKEEAGCMQRKLQHLAQVGSGRSIHLFHNPTQADRQGICIRPTVRPIQTHSFCIKQQGETTNCRNSGECVCACVQACMCVCDFSNLKCVCFLPAVFMLTQKHACKGLKGR